MLEKQMDKLVPIFINKVLHEVAAGPSTGGAVKQAGGYGADFDLFVLQGEGDRAGRLVADGEAIAIKPGLHFRALPANRNFGRQLHPERQASIDELSEHFAVEVHVDGAFINLVIPSFELPAGLYNLATTRLLLRLPQDPNGALDMFWVDPSIRLANGAIPKQADAIEQYLGQAWRRFSWHRQTPWKPGRDTPLSYMSFVEERLEKGV